MALERRTQTILAFAIAIVSIAIGSIAYVTGFYDQFGMNDGTISVLMDIGFLSFALGGLYEYRYGRAPLQRAVLQVLIAIGGIGYSSDSLVDFFGVNMGTGLITSFGSAVFFIALGGYFVHIFNSRKQFFGST